MLHHGRQLDHERPRQVADRGALVLLEARKNCPPRGIHQGCKGAVELTGSIVHHSVKYVSACAGCQVGLGLTTSRFRGGLRIRWFYGTPTRVGRLADFRAQRLDPNAYAL